MFRPAVQSILITLLSVTALLAAAPPDSVTRMPETTSTASGLSEDAPVGDTQRPEWTSARRFPNTRVYIQQEPWEAGVETWWRFKNHRDGTASNRLLQEVEIGLPYRMQLDLYNDIEGDQDARFHDQTVNVELRWAFADWGKLWGNPTLYAEYKFADHHWGPDVYELKVLFGDEFAQRWHWGVNFVWESEMGWEREDEFQIPGGLSYTVLDRRLGVGVEFLYDHDTLVGGRSNPANQFNIGPSIQYRITDKAHLDLSCMFGTNNESDREITWVVFGYDFGGPSGHSERAFTPSSGQHN